MKTQIKALLPLSSMSVSEKITVGNFVGLTFPSHQEDYPKTCPYTIDQFAGSTLRLTNANAAAVDGGRTAHNELMAAETEFDGRFGAFRDWANQADVALGDTTKINNLGLKAGTGESQHAGMPTVPVMRELSNISSGHVTAGCPSVTFATNYNYFVAYGDTEPADDDFYHLLSSPRSQESLDVTRGLIPWIRMSCSGTAGMSARSACKTLPRT